MAITPNFWSAEGISFLKKTEADFDTHYLSNGTYNLWLKFDANGVLNLKESAQYPLDKVFTGPETQKALRYFGNGIPLVPYQVVEGNYALAPNQYYWITT
jgi:hypothetical protein